MLFHYCLTQTYPMAQRYIWCESRHIYKIYPKQYQRGCPSTLRMLWWPLGSPRLLKPTVKISRIWQGVRVEKKKKRKKMMRCRTHRPGIV